MISVIDQQPAGTAPDLVALVQEIFSPTGLLSRVRSFEYRPQQQQLAVAVAKALERTTHLAVEAGTGVGKSLGYLIPAILFATANHKKAIVCTHTINLQEQLTEKDLPMLSQILPVKFKYTMLKGRANYLCTRRLAKAMKEADSLFTSPEVEELKRIYEWSLKTEDGSLSDFDIEPDPKVWAQVCSERGLCSPKSCGQQSDFAKENRLCFFQRARSRILAADVLVLNHTLFFTLVGALEEEPEGGILFKNDFVIFDEAHTVEQVASKHIGVSVSNAQLRFALHRLWNPNTQKGLLSVLRQGNAVPFVSSALSEGEKFFRAVELECDRLAEISKGRAAPRRGAHSETDLSGAGKQPRAWTEIRIRRPNLVEDNVTLAIQRLREAVSDLIKLTDDKETGQELVECNRRLAELRDSIALFLSHSEDHCVYWVERAGKTQRNLTLNAAPIDVAEYLRRRLFQSETSVIMTSATLAVPPAAAVGGPARGPHAAAPNQSAEGGSSPLAYFARRVGAQGATLLQVGSPFDFERQMKVFVAGKMPDPRDPGYQSALIRWIEHFIRMTHGKAFVLFTNFKLMHDTAQLMRPVFEELGIECFVQGTGTPRSVMLEKFKGDVDSVLFGTDSFWQGVDVPGESLSNVIITRLPFAVPDHPLIQARVEKIEAEGGNSFAEFSLPEAILKFRQGVGRLIRAKTDSGIIVILDNRVLTKSYGKAFLNAIPKCPVEIV